MSRQRTQTLRFLDDPDIRQLLLRRADLFVHVRAFTVGDTVRLVQVLLHQAHFLELKICRRRPDDVQKVADLLAFLQIDDVLISSLADLAAQAETVDRAAHVLRHILRPADQFHVITLARIRNGTAGQKCAPQRGFLAAALAHDAGVETVGDIVAALLDPQNAYFAQDLFGIHVRRDRQFVDAAFCQRRRFTQGQRGLRAEIFLDQTDEQARGGRVVRRHFNAHLAAGERDDARETQKAGDLRQLAALLLRHCSRQFIFDIGSKGHIWIIA